MTQYVSVLDLAQRYHINRATVWRWAQRGIIPAPVKLSEQCTRWRLAEIERCDAERDTKAA